MTGGGDKGTVTSALQKRLRSLAGDIALECVECGLCRKDCLFLQQHGLPKLIAEQTVAGGVDSGLSFECSLCGLCRAVCPQKIDPSAMLAMMRQAAAAAGRQDYRPYRSLLAYERWGSSPLFSWYGLPEGCERLFFPGCTLAGSRAGRVLQVYDHLRQWEPALGIALDCCTKPSHDLGRRDHFRDMFLSLRQGLARQGIREVLVACPSCYRVWDDYGGDIAVRTIYEVMREAGPAPYTCPPASLTVHDSCQTRDVPAVHRSVRGLLQHMGFSLAEMKHHGTRTLCCGEGGAVCHLAPATGMNWARLRTVEADGRTVVTYCAGCTNFLGRLRPAVHLTDLFFAPEKTLAGRVRAASGPLTWLHRLLLKERLKRTVRPAVTGSRDRAGRLRWRRL